MKKLNSPRNWDLKSVSESAEASDKYRKVDIGDVCGDSGQEAIIDSKLIGFANP